MFHYELTPDSSVEDAKTLLRQPPGPWPAGWMGFPCIVEAFKELYAEAAQSAPPPPAWTHDRGIVICAGGWRFFPSLYVTVRQIRATGCRLPIQVWYLGDKGEFDVRMSAALKPYNVSWACGNSYCRENGIHRRCLGGWELKPFAALHSPFREVICLDADSYPAYNPEEFMAHPEYARVGAAFWPDQQKLEAGQWERFGLAYHDEPAFETGQYIVDKSRHWEPLWLTNWMNDYSDYVYSHIYGDKDTYHLCWRKLGRECCIPSHHAGWDQIAFLQVDFSGRPLFIHRTRDKFRWLGEIDGQPVPAWYMTSQWDGEPRFVPSLAAEQQCHDFCKESSELLRPHLHFRFIDGAAGWCRAIWDQVCLYDEYELPDEFSLHDVIVDVGANVGAFSRSCLRRGAGHVFSVEPMEINIEHLKYNLGDYGSPRVTIVEKAVWDRDGQLRLMEDPCHVSGNTSTFTAIFQAKQDQPGIDVPCVTLDSILADAIRKSPNGRIRLIKIDSEGGEYPGLLNSKLLHAVDAIIGETHENVMIDQVVYSTGSVVAKLEEEGFQVRVKKNGPNTHLFWASR